MSNKHLRAHETHKASAVDGKGCELVSGREGGWADSVVVHCTKAVYI